MKGRKLLCLDVETLEKLEGINASELVDQLLKEHFGSSRETLEKRKAAIVKETLMIEAEEGEISAIEREADKETAMRNRIDNEKAKKKIAYDKEKAPLAKKVKNKEITFEEYMTAVEVLKEKHGLIHG